MHSNHLAVDKLLLIVGNPYCNRKTPSLVKQFYMQVFPTLSQNRCLTEIADDFIFPKLFSIQKAQFVIDNCKIQDPLPAVGWSKPAR